jgi:Gypsy protein
LSSKSIGSGKVLVKNTLRPIKIKNTCGIADHTIQGTFFISFSNCSISINGETFDNVEIRHREKFELLPSFEMKINQKNIEPLIDLHALHDLHIKNRDKLREIQENHQESKSTLLTSVFIIIPLFAVIIAVIGAAAYYFLIKDKIESIRRLFVLNREELTADVITSNKPTAPTLSVFMIGK